MEQYMSDARWVGLASVLFRLCQLFLSEENWLNKPTLFNFFAGGTVSITDYCGCILLLILGVLLGMIGLNRTTDAITALRASETWEDMNDALIEKNETPANVILRGIISDSRVSAYVSLGFGLIDVAFFGICFIQGTIVLKIFQPLTEKHMIDTLVWISILFSLTFLSRVLLLWRSFQTKKKLIGLKRLLTIFPRDTVETLMVTLRDSEFYSGPQEGLLLLCPEFEPVVDFRRQISFELGRINNELDRIASLSKAEVHSLCDTAMEKSSIDVSRYGLEALMHLVIATSAILGYPFQYYHAAASFRWFGGFSRHLTYWCEVVRNSTIVVEVVISYFIIEPAVAAVKTYRERKAKML